MSAVETRDNCCIQTIQIILFMYSILINCKQYVIVKTTLFPKVYLDNHILQLKTPIFFTCLLLILLSKIIP